MNCREPVTEQQAGPEKPYFIWLLIGKENEAAAPKIALKP